MPDNITAQTRGYFTDPKHTKWQFAAFARYCYNLPSFPNISQTLRRQTAWNHWEQHLKDLSEGGDGEKKAKADDLLRRIHRNGDKDTKGTTKTTYVQNNFTINAVGANTVHAGATTTTTNNFVNVAESRVGISGDVMIERESEELNGPAKGKEEEKEEVKGEKAVTPPSFTTNNNKRKAEYAPWPTTPPLSNIPTYKRRQTQPHPPTITTTAATTTTNTTTHPNPSSPTSLPLRQRLLLLQDTLSTLSTARDRQLAKLRREYSKFLEKERRMACLLEQVTGEVARLVELREVREGDGMLTSKDETEEGE